MRKSLMAGVALTGLLALGLAAWYANGIKTVPLSPEVLNRNSLGCKDVLIRRMASEVDIQAEMAAVEIGIGPLISRANEHHDCQRLIHQRDVWKDTYEGLVSLWVLAAAQGPDAMYYAKPKGVTVAGIVLQEGPEYDPLRISDYKNCLVLRSDPNLNDNIGPDEQGKTWAAWVVGIGSDQNKKCADQVLDLTAADSLNVYRYNTGTGVRLTAGRIEDAGDSDYYIGIECGQGWWCLIGVPEPGVDPAKAKKYPSGRYDRQRMAYFNEDDELRVAKLWGEIEFDSRAPDTVPGYEDDFVQVATIRFEGNDKAARRHIRRKLGLPLNQDLPNEIAVYLHHPKNSPEDIWLIRYTPNGIPKLAKVALNKAHVARGARWRWSEFDEGSWVYCPVGCCGDDYP
jgi:hypothetical protein